MEERKVVVLRVLVVPTSKSVRRLVIKSGMSPPFGAPLSPVLVGYGHSVLKVAVRKWANARSEIVNQKKLIIFVVIQYARVDRERIMKTVRLTVVLLIIQLTVV